MGCIPYACDEEVKQILETSGILDGGYTPTEQDIQVLETAIDMYGREEISRFLEANGKHGEYAFQAISALVYTADLLGSETLIKDLTNGEKKFIGGVFELAYATVHHDEIAGIEMPTFHVAKSDLHEYTRPGPDIWMKDNSIVELKNFNFHKEYYESHAKQVAEKVADQAFRRLEEGATKVDIVFNERLGEMPDSLQSALDSAIGGIPVSTIHLNNKYINMTSSEFKDTGSFIEHFTELRKKHWLRVGMQRVVEHMEHAEYTWDHQTGGRLPSKDMMRVNRFCVQDIVLGLIALKHDQLKNRIEVDVFLTASIPEYEADSGARALTLMILCEAYATGSRMEIYFTPYVEGCSVPSDIVNLADRLGVDLSQAESGIILPKEAVDLYVALTGFSPNVQSLLQTLESGGRISREQLCFSIHHGLWERMEVEAILTTCPNPNTLLAGNNLPEERHPFLDDLHYGRGALLLGHLDRHLRYRAHSSGDQVELLEDDERKLEKTLDGDNFLATFSCQEEELKIPWIIAPAGDFSSILSIGESFSVLVRPRAMQDLVMELEKDYSRAEQLAAFLGKRIYILMTRDFERLPPDRRENLIKACPTSVGLMEFPEFISTLDEEIIRRIGSNRGKHI